MPRRPPARSAKSPAAPHPSFPLRHPVLCFALLSAFLLLALYGPFLSNPFIYDDLDTILHNPNLASAHTVFQRFVLSPVQFTTELRPTSGATWRPLFWITLALDRRLFGLAPSAFHATSLLLHWLSSLLLFTLLRRLRLPLPIAVLTPLVWLTLPVTSEAVAWASACSYPLCLVCLLLATHAALEFLHRPRALALVGIALASVAALLSNETALLLLPVTLALALLAPRLSSTSSPTPSPRDHTPPTSSLPLRFAPVLVVLATDLPFLAIRHLLHATTGAASRPTVWAIAPTLLRYLGWIFVPLHLSIERSTSTPPDLPTPSALLALVILAALVALLVLLRRRLPLACAGTAFALASLLPVSGLVPLYQGMAERFTYIPSLGIALALAALAVSAARSTRRLSLAALAILVFAFALRLHARLVDWSDPALLYGSSLAANPQSPSLFFNLAFTARERGDLLTARQNYLRATELNPSFARAFASLGDIDTQLHHPAQAVADLQHALALNPSDASSTTALALAFQDLGNTRAAEQAFQHAIALAPADPTPHTDLAVLLSQSGQTDAAIREFQAAIALNPQDTTAYFDLGTMFQQLGQDTVALAFYRKVLDLKPDDPDTLLRISHLHIDRPTS